MRISLSLLVFIDDATAAYKSRHFHFAQNQTKSLCFDNALTLSLIISYTFYTEAQIKGNNETSHVKLIARVV